MQSEGRPILHPLNGLRGVIIASVMILHFGGSIKTLLPELNPLVTYSGHVVFRMDLFFMISGFITAYVFIPLDKPMTASAYGRFLLSRFIRLYPSYLAVFLLLAGLVLAAPFLNITVRGDYPWNIVPFRLLLLHAWPFCQWGVWTWNYPTWFLSALTFGYVFVFPVCWFLVQRLRRSSHALAWVFGPVIFWAVFSQIPGLEDYHMLVRVTSQFLAGTALFVLLVDKHWLVRSAQWHLNLTALAFCLAALIQATEVFPNARDAINSLLLLATPFLVAGVTAEKCATARVLATQPLQWLGSMTYALFLTHAVALKVLSILLPAARYAPDPWFVRWPVGLGYVAVVLGLALALHYLVEIPCTNALKVYFRRDQRLETGERSGEHGAGTERIQRKVAKSQRRRPGI
jgi:peptidoglycan/LPS O-acetylase OafA/YrhL